MREFIWVIEQGVPLHIGKEFIWRIMASEGFFSTRDYARQNIKNLKEIFGSYNYKYRVVKYIRIAP